MNYLSRIHPSRRFVGGVVLGFALVTVGLIAAQAGRSGGEQTAAEPASAVPTSQPNEVARTATSEAAVTEGPGTAQVVELDEEPEAADGREPTAENVEGSSETNNSSPTVTSAPDSDPDNQPAKDSPTSSTATTSTTTSTTTTGADGSSNTTTTTATGPTGNQTLSWGYDASQPSAGWTKPALGQPSTDPAYGVAVRRLTSADGTRFNRNTYSRRQAENANGTHILTYHGSAAYHVYDRDQGSLVAALDIHPDAEPQWHPTNSDRIRHLLGPNSYVGGLQLLETSVSSGQTTVIADLTSRIQAAVPSALYMKDRAEGSPSRDGNHYAWLIYNSSEKPIGLVSYDLATDKILGITTDLVDDQIDWVSSSATGQYVVAGHNAGTFVYDADLTNRRLVTAALEHSDLVLGADGTDRYVYIDFTSDPDTGGWLTSVDLRTLERVKIFDAYDQANTSMHISGKGYEKPGWVVVSTYSCKVSGAWTCEKVMAVELAENGRVLNLAHTYNCGDGYWTETHAVVNRAFTRVYFNSDGGSCGIDAEVYRLDVPEFD